MTNDYFDKRNGDQIQLEEGEALIRTRETAEFFVYINDHTFPVYSFDRKYLGFVENGKFKPIM
jgi:hypothetical protein